MPTSLISESTPQLVQTPSVFFTLGELMRGDDRQFVSNAYWAMLGRAVDETGLSIYTAMLAGGKSRIEVLLELRSSSEGHAHGANLDGLDGAKTLVELLSYQDHAFVSCAYKTLLLRPIDAGALTSYSAELGRGMDRLHVLNELVTSDEFKSKNAMALEIERDGVVSEAHPAKTDKNGVLSLGDEGQNMPHLPASKNELLARGDADFVRGLYQILLARDADAEGLENYAVRLKSDLTRAEVVRAISHSGEREARRLMLRQIESSINDGERRKSPVLGFAAKMRHQALEQLIVEQKYRRLENQLIAMSCSQKAQLTRLESLLSRSAETSRATQPKTAPLLKLNQLSPLAQDIYFRLKSGLDKRKEQSA